MGASTGDLLVSDDATLARVLASGTRRVAIHAEDEYRMNDREGLRIPGDPVAGNVNGDVTVVEFYDIRCPYCRRMVPVVADLLKRDPNVRVVYPAARPHGVAGVRHSRQQQQAQRSPDKHPKPCAQRAPKT